MPAERVPEFERACLDSDMCLAEVAACHQILTLVLGHPAEVDVDSRQRMYDMLVVAPDVEREGGRPDAETGANEVTGGEDGVAASESGVVVSSSPRKTTRSRPEIPDYLREPSGSPLWRYVAAAALT